MIKQRNQFLHDDLDTSYPFGMEVYDEAMFHETQHMNEDRLRWVTHTIGRIRQGEMR